MAATLRAGGVLSGSNPKKMNNTAVRYTSLIAAIAALGALSAAQLNAQNGPGPADQALRALYQPAPAYSYNLRHDEVEGQVVVSFRVTPSGDVADEAIVSSTQARLNRPTLLALSKWKYAPAMKAGAPVTSRVLETVRFTIPDAIR